MVKVDVLIEKRDGEVFGRAICFDGLTVDKVRRLDSISNSFNISKTNLFGSGKYQICLGVTTDRERARFLEFMDLISDDNFDSDLIEAIEISISKSKDKFIRSMAF